MGPCYRTDMAGNDDAVRLRVWRITTHARERLADRAIATSELVEALLQPVRTDTVSNGFVQWGRHLGVAWDYGNDGPNRVKIIMTVLINGSSEDNWESDVARHAQERTSNIAIDDLLEQLKPRDAGKQTRRPWRQRPRQSPVVVTNRYDGLPDHMLEAAREMLKRAGRDPDDLSPVRRIGNRLEIMLD